jgi:hypothetical protein
MSGLELHAFFVRSAGVVMSSGSSFDAQVSIIPCFLCLVLFSTISTNIP